MLVWRLAEERCSGEISAAFDPEPCVLPLIPHAAHASQRFCRDICGPGKARALVGLIISCAPLTVFDAGGAHVTTVLVVMHAAQEGNNLRVSKLKHYYDFNHLECSTTSTYRRTPVS
jgi:hypothetical protein